MQRFLLYIYLRAEELIYEGLSKLFVKLNHWYQQFSNLDVNLLSQVRFAKGGRMDPWSAVAELKRKKITK
jgi:hypothetical protein